MPVFAILTQDEQQACAWAGTIRNHHQPKGAIVKRYLYLMMVCGLGVVTATAYAQDESAPEPTVQEEAASVEPPNDGPFQTIEDKASYLIGQNLGRQLQQQWIEVNPAVVAQGIGDALSNSDSKIPWNEAQAILTAFEKQTQDHLAELARKNDEAGRAFLETNKLQEGVVALPSGLQYKVITEGDGPSPKSTDKVVTHYRGTLVDGTVFDSSYQYNEPATFGVTQVIAGWTEALQRMKVGDKWQLFVPGNLAYGPQGRAPLIEPNALLIFEIELLDIQTPPVQSTAVQPPTTPPTGE